MTQYLMFAENIYNKIKDEELFSHDCIENMNLLMTCIRREIKGTEFKLKYNFIDFVELFSKQLDECMIYAELSGDFPLGDSRQPIYKSLRPFDLVS